MRLYKSGDKEQITDAVDPLAATHMPDEYFEQGLFISVLRDSKVVACGGLMLANEDTAEAWIKVSEQFVKHGTIHDRIRALRTFSEALGIMDDTLGFPVLYGRVIDGFKEGERMAKFMGFLPIDQSEEMDGQKYNFYRRIA